MSSLSMTQSLPSKEQDLALNEASTVSDQVCDVIAQHGVQQVFMVPGGFVDNFAQSIAHHHSLSAIVCASEAGAAYMADGYARASGKFGVCMGISGPGASNMITGLSLSTADQIPVLAITGEPPLSWRDRDAIQDPGSAGLRSIDLLKQVCVAQYQLFDANILDNIIQRSLNALNSGKRGAVHLSISMDIQASTPVKQAPPIMPAMHRPADYQALDQVIHALSQHKKCVLLAGAGVRHSDASAALIDFAEASGIPVATTMSAKGDFPEHHPLALGVFGWAGTHLANTLLMGDDIECLIVVGSKLGQIATMGWHEQLAKRCLIHIDAHADHLNRTYCANLSVCSDADAALRYMTAKLNHSPTSLTAFRTKWRQQHKAQLAWHLSIPELDDSQPIHPGAALQQLCTLAPDTTQVFVDNGAHTFFACHYWHSTRPKHFFNAIKYSGAMGWAIPASIGAKLARPQHTTVAIVGDGCMLMQGIEIQTASRYGLQGCIFVVMNNRAHGNPKLRTRHHSQHAQAITDIAEHDWAGFARSLGLHAYTATRTSELKQIFTRALAETHPVLIDIQCGLYDTPTTLFDQTFMQSFKQNLAS